MIIFKREFRKSQKGLWIWTAILGGLIFLIVSLYPEFAKDKEMIEQMMKAYPESMLKAMNMEKLNFTTMLGFYAVEGYLMVTLVGSIYASIMASNMLAKEESEKTIEFLLAKPVSRTQIVTQKLLVVITNLLIFNVVITALVYIAFQMADEHSVDMETFAMLALAPVLLHLTFASISFFISSIMRRSRNILSVSLGIVFVTYFFDIIQGISDKMDNLKYVTPFEYVNASEIVENVGLDPFYVTIMVIIMVLTVALSYFVYNKKDISV